MTLMWGSDYPHPDGIQAAGIPPMTDEEIVAEVKAARAERRAREGRH